MCLFLRTLYKDGSMHARKNSVICFAVIIALACPSITDVLGACGATNLWDMEAPEEGGPIDRDIGSVAGEGNYDTSASSPSAIFRIMDGTIPLADDTATFTGEHWVADADRNGSFPCGEYDAVIFCGGNPLHSNIVIFVGAGCGE
jgi:hypothetical protein